MSIHFYLDCATDELIRSSYEEEYFRDRAPRLDSSRFYERPPSEVVYKIGPSDLALPNTFLLTLFLEGRLIVGADVEIGWQHQGLEKSIENATWQEAGQLLTRINPNENSSLGLCYTLALEQLFGMSAQVSVFDRLLRLVMLESERVYHHWLIIDRMSAFMISAQKRETLQPSIVLSKKLYALLSLQVKERGARRKEAEKLIEELRELSAPAIEFLKENQQIQTRLEGTVKIDRSTGLANGLSGIYLRAAGVADDVRYNHSELPYAMLDFQPQTMSDGSAYARFFLRLLEIENSLLLMTQALRLTKEATVASTFAEISAAPGQVATAYLEAPEGELAITLCSDGHFNPYRARIKTPSFALTSALWVFLKGSDLDDVVLILNSLGINTLETDR